MSNKQYKEQAIENGKRLRAELMGEEHIERYRDEGLGYLKPWQDFAHASVFDALWERPFLSRNTRIIVNLSIMSALCRANQLERYITVALENGVSKEEIVEIFLHTAAYAGAPAGNDAIMALKRVVNAREAKS